MLKLFQPVAANHRLDYTDVIFFVIESSWRAVNRRANKASYDLIHLWHNN